MEFIKSGLAFLVLIALSKQDPTYDLDFQKNSITGTYNTILFCNVSFTGEEFVNRINWYKGEERLKTYNLEFMNSPTRKTIRAASFFKIPNNGHTDGTYWCNIITKRFNSTHMYNKTFVVEKRPVVEPIDVYFPNWYESKMWVKLYVEQEGSTIFMRCTFDMEKFVENEDWYHNGEKIKFNNHIRGDDLRVLKIENLNSTDKGTYTCVSPQNEYSTVLIVTKNVMKISKKIKH